MLEVAILIGGVAQRGLGTIGLARNGGATRIVRSGSSASYIRAYVGSRRRTVRPTDFCLAGGEAAPFLKRENRRSPATERHVFLENLGELATSNSMAYSALPRGRPEGDCAGLNGRRRPLHSSKRTSRCRYRRVQNARQALQSLQNRLFDTGRLSAKPSEPLENQ
jgi:hypothetical protein